MKTPVNSDANLTSESEIYESFTRSMEILIKSLLVSNKLVVHNLTSRTKTEISIGEKLQRKTYTSKKELTDITGIRITTYFADDIELVARVIEDEFNIDIKNSVDKRNLTEFGYSSLHYVCSLNDKRSHLNEYVKYKEMKFELQIRTILQHAWAEIEHDMGYKGKSDLTPVEQKSFKRIAALLDQADIEFQNLKNRNNSIKERNRISIDSIKLFIDESELVKELDHQILDILRTENKDLNLSKHNNLFAPTEKNSMNKIPGTSRMGEFAFLEIKSISELEELLEKSKIHILETSKLIFKTEYAVYGIDANSRGYLPRGFSLDILIFHLVLRCSDLVVVVKEYLKSYYKQRYDDWGDNDEKLERLIDTILDLYQKTPYKYRKATYAVKFT